MATQQEVIKAFMKALDVHTLTKKSNETDVAFTTRIIDAAVKACSSFDGVQAVIKQMLKDRDKAGNADTFLKKYCGIDLSNKDTGAITGKDAGGSKVKTAESIVPESGTLDENFEENYFTVNGLTVKLGKEENDSIVTRSFDSLSKQEIYLWRSLHSYWIKGGLELISESYGENFGFTQKSSAMTKTLYIIFYNKDDGRDAGTGGGTSKNNPLKIYINLQVYGSATGKNGAEDDQLYLDRTLAHELTHAVMRTNINEYSYLPSFIREGVAQITHGSDDDYQSSIKKIANSSSLLKKALSLTDYSKMVFSNVDNPTYAAGYIFMRYLAKQAANGGAYQYNKSVTGTSGKNTINNFISGATIQALGGNDTIRNYASNVTIESGAGKNKIVNENRNVSIRGGNNADHIYNESLASNVSVFAWAGADSIFNHAQKVTIDGGNDADYISNFNGKVSIFGGAGNDSLYNASVGSSVTLDGGNDNDYISNKGKKVLIRGGEGADTIRNEGGNVTINCGNGNDSVRNYASSTVTIQGGDGADHIANYGAAASIIGGNGNDSLYGDAGNDTILGGANNDKLYGYAGNDKLYGGNNNDSLWGGKGNDSLWGGSGKDIFVYKPGEDTDRIKDYSYSEGDVLKILKTDGSAGGTFSKSGLSGGNLVLTISGGGSVIFEGVNKGDKFNINSKTYTFNGSKLK